MRLVVALLLIALLAALFGYGFIAHALASIAKLALFLIIAGIVLAVLGIGRSR